MKVLVNEFGYLGAIYLFTWFSVKFTFSKTENLNVKEMIVFVFVVFYLNNLYTTGMVVLYVLLYRSLLFLLLYYSLTVIFLESVFVFQISVNLFISIC